MGLVLLYTVGSLNVPLLVLALLPLSFGLFVPASVQIVLGQEYLPKSPGTASGVTLGLAVSFGGLLSPVLGRIGDQQGLAMVWVWLILPALLSLLVVSFLPNERKLKQQRSAQSGIAIEQNRV
jgi:FSR family fosmidomycin resistance protein-like MFS transporter